MALVLSRIVQTEFFFFNTVHTCFINTLQHGVSSEEANSNVPCTFGGISS